MSKFMFPEEVKASISKDHLYTSKLFELVDFNISELRKINLVGLLISSLILGSACYKYFVKERFIEKSSWLFPSTFISTIIISQLPSLWIERVPAYNNLTSFISLSIVGLFFFWMCCKSKSILYPLIIGILISMIVIIRVPSGLSLLFSILLFMILFRRNKAFQITFLCLGLIIGLVFHFLIIESTTNFIESMKNGILFHSYLNNHNDDFILLRYTKELWGTLIFSFGYNKYLFLITSIVYIWITKFGKTTWLPYIFYISLIYISLHHFIIGDINGGHSLYWFQWRYYFGQFILFSIILGIHCLSDNFKNLKLLFSTQFNLSFILLSFPLFFALGTSNIIMYNMNFYTSFFMIGLFLIFLKIITFGSFSYRNFHIYFLLFLFCLGPAHAYLKSRLSSSFYTICEASHGSLHQHNNTLRINGNYLYVNDSIQDLSCNLNDALSNHRGKLQYLLNFSTMPGLNFLTALPHPIQSWTIQMNDNFTLENIEESTFLQSAILIRSNDTEVIGQLTKCFPNWKISHSKKFTIDYNLGSKIPQLLLFIPNNIEK